MHEISLVRNIFSTLESEFPKEELDRMLQIELKVGLLANVEPVLMQNAFEAVTTAEEKYQAVKLNIELVPIEVYCADCDTHSTIENYKFACQSCGKPNNNVVKGTELLIQRVEFESEEEEQYG
jgi:hydrogenase nickel incorporation protein HypA/HybF